jgi:hypothetical protein
MGPIGDLLDRLGDDARSYGVSPRFFVALYLFTWPIWYYTMWWIVSGWHRQDRQRMRRGIIFNRIATVTPYAYVLIAGGSNMTWAWYVFAVVLPIVTTTWFLHKTKDDAWVKKWWTFYKLVLDRFSSDPKSVSGD